MIVWVVAALAAVAFAFVFVRSGLVQVASGAVTQAKAAVAVIKDQTLDDDAKETAVQRAAGRMFLAFGGIVIRAAAALAAPAAVMGLADLVGLAGFDASMDATLSWEFLIGATVVGTGAWMAMRPRGGAAPAAQAPAGAPAFEAQYSRTDRLLHKLATGLPVLQKFLSELEDKRFADEYGPIAGDRPVFVTSLPRAGTTLTLEVICAEPEFAAHTYRNMPFVMAPLWWDRMSRRHQQKGEAQERAHGDGMQVDYDSYEAFEELIWKSFWPERYLKDRIRPWSAAEKGPDGEDFPAFMRRHMRKLIALTRRRGRAAGRYVSKNNGNVARIPWLVKTWDDALVLIPFRDPVGHIASMLKQHRNFAALHETDAFARDYMRSIGHFDFGAALKPVNFGGWMDAPGRPTDPMEAEFWAAYWIAAMEHVLDVAGARAVPFSYDALCADPEGGLAWLSGALGIEGAALRAQAGRFRAPTEYDAQALGISQARRDRIAEIHARLQEISPI